VTCVLNGTGRGGGGGDAKFKKRGISLVTKFVIPMEQGSSLFRK